MASLGITVHAEFSFSLKRFIQMHFKALFIKEKSIMFNPPFSRSPIIVFFFILAILLSQIKLKVILFTWSQNFSGTGRTDAMKISFERPRDLFFQVELIFVSSSYSVCFPKHLICHKNLIYHLFSCSSKNVLLIQRQIPLAT